jgi:hypothetical protein
VNWLQPHADPDPQRIARRLLQRLPGYTPEWAPGPGSRGNALIQVFARYLALLGVGAKGLAQRNLLAMLDSLGVQLQPAQAARVPVVFNLSPTAAADVTLAAESQLAAQPAPPAPDAATPSSGDAAQPLLFFTEQTVTLARARLAMLYSIDPGSDTYADHWPSLTSGFTVFGDLIRTEHAIYLGHDTLFKLGGQGITLLLQCTFDVTPPSPLDIHWQYLSVVGWVTLQRVEEEDTTRGLTQDGQIALRLQRGPDAKQETFGGQNSYWLRGSLNTPVIRGENLRPSPLTINDLGVRVQFQKQGLLPESAFADAAALDVSKGFLPFGSQGASYSTFYLASRETFQRTGGRVKLDMILARAGKPSSDISLVWEYFSSAGWQNLHPGFAAADGSGYKFDDHLVPHTVAFNCPDDWTETTVNGVSNLWLRVRIAAGNFGDPNTVTVTSPSANVTTVTPSAVTPVIKEICLSYSYVTDPAPLQHCVTSNDFVFTDQTDAALWPDRSFDPFTPISDMQPAIHFGFDQPLPSGLISLFIQAPGAEDLEPDVSSSYIWEYLARNGWQQIGVRDETVGMRQSGMLQFIGAPDAVAAMSLGAKNLYRLRARLTNGAQITQRPLSGVWLNAAWASHRVRIELELLGSADGTPRQALRFAQVPVLAGETVEVKEWSGTGEGWRLVTANLADGDYRFERDPVSSAITAIWVQWRELPNLYSVDAFQRVFVLERATGLIRFGDGTHGMVPPAGCPIVASYLSGGGLAGNVGPGTVTQLRSALPSVASITNPVAAGGGADSELLHDVTLRGPQQLRNRGRAISARDIEWIARDASPEVARARCLSVTGPAGHVQRGWITVIVLPRSADVQPTPTAELQRRVSDSLRTYVPATVAARLQIAEPSYVPVSVAAEIVPIDPSEAAIVEALLRRRLNDFLHPLTGGDGSGWEFGASLQLSNIASVIESTQGVDYARSIQLFVSGAEQCQTVIVPRDALICAGAPELRLTVGEP